MKDQVFGEVYAGHYDQLYGDKDYERECDLIEDVFGRYTSKRVQTVLDLGCGTGSHAIPLARRGLRVVGVDRSPDMLERGRKKAADGGLPPGRRPPEFVLGDVRSVELGRRFDAVLMMFAVLGYQLTNEDVLSALCTVRKHLQPGGLFICDVWYGPAVLSIGPSERVKVIPTADGQIIRAAKGSLDTYRHLCRVDYHLWELAGSQLVGETRESHEMRYFFPQELSFFMERAELSMECICAFGHPYELPSEATWNVLVTGKCKNT